MTSMILLVLFASILFIVAFAVTFCIGVPMLIEFVRTLFTRPIRLDETEIFYHLND